MIRMYYHPTPNPAKVALFLEETGLSYEVVPVDTAKGQQHTPEFRAINPNGKVPAIVDTDGPGGTEVRVFDSSAILLYLAEKTGKLMGSPADRGELLSWLFYIGTGLGPFSGQAVHFQLRAPEKLPYANTSPPSTRARARARVGSENQRPWPADKVERWAIDRLIPYAKNARTHTDAQIAAIAASVKEWGWTTPVLVGEDGGLIAGHARILAARQLGIAEIPVMVAAGWSEAQERAYVLADNQLAITGSGWDPELLRLELGELQLGGFDLSLTGFGDLELKDLLVERTAGLTDPDDAPAVPEHPVSQTGDLWLLGATVTCPKCRKTSPLERAKLGIAEIPVMVAAGWSEAQKRAYVVADSWRLPGRAGTQSFCGSNSASYKRGLRDARNSRRAPRNPGL
jgi:glutathione S-transferase